MLTCGFFDSIDHDRLYDALQFTSLFDGIIRDGVFMSIGNCFRVIPGEGMMVLVDTGRAWFNHTWTLNDALLPIYVPQSEVILNRMDAIVLEVNRNTDVRENTIKLIKGVPTNTPPQPPALMQGLKMGQYPLAYITVRAGVTSIRAADITSMVGTSQTPYVTGILDTVNIDNLIDQWRDQWREFFEAQVNEIHTYTEFWESEWRNWYNAQTGEMADYIDFWKKEWERWYKAQTEATRNAYLQWKDEWELWSNQQKKEMEGTSEEWEALWQSWFYTYINQNQQMISQWQEDRDEEFQTWFDSLHEMLEDNVAANLSEQILELKSCCGIVKDFMENLRTEHAIYSDMYDHIYSKYDDVIDSADGFVIDDMSNVINGVSNESNPILDSDGQNIQSRIIFAVK